MCHIQRPPKRPDNDRGRINNNIILFDSRGIEKIYTIYDYLSDDGNPNCCVALYAAVATYYYKYTYTFIIYVYTCVGRRNELVFSRYAIKQ